MAKNLQNYFQPLIFSGRTVTEKAYEYHLVIHRATQRKVFKTIDVNCFEKQKSFCNNNFWGQ